MCVWRQEKGGLVTASCSVLEKRNGTEFNFRLRGVETARRAAELRRVCGAVERGELATARSCHVGRLLFFLFRSIFVRVLLLCEGCRYGSAHSFEKKKVNGGEQLLWVTVTVLG